MKTNKTINHIARQAGLDRKDHFENGGSLHEWRGGLSHTFVDKRKEDNKNKCRNRKDW